MHYFFPIIYDMVTLLHFISSSASAGPHCLLVIHGWWERLIKYRFKTVQVTLSKHLDDHFSSKYQLLCQDIHHLCLASAPDAAQSSDWLYFFSQSSAGLSPNTHYQHRYAQVSPKICNINFLTGPYVPYLRGLSLEDRVSTEPAVYAKLWFYWE